MLFRSAEKLKSIIATAEGSFDNNDPWFRLILTCNPYKINEVLLSRCIKIAIDTPKTMKQKILSDLSILKSKEEITLQTSTNITSFEPRFRRLLFSLIILHAVIDKCNAFGNRVWGEPFYTTQTEIKVSEQLLLYSFYFFGDLSKKLSKPILFPWAELQKVISEIVIGGLITNRYDIKILNSMIAIHLNEEVEKGN